MHDRPPPDSEIAAEQAYVDAAYARLDEMRRSAERVRAAYSEVGDGGTHQARLERDIAYELTERRLSDLAIGDSPLCFGRLDATSGTWYIGRLGVDDAEHTPLVVDWRAPIAEPFYRATAVEPMGVARRRHFITRRGREIISLDDEVFDREASAAAGLSITGEGALLLALERHRTGRMGDIVATIQAEQDEAIRADLPGVLVVTGGPGTGKTAVALHRAAYLLYTHRRRLASKGVLLIGPSPVFLRYIEQVLPSLGEQDVQIATIAGLKSRLTTTTVDAPATAALKGDARMAAVIARAVVDRERPLRHDLGLSIDGLRVRLTRDASVRIVQSARRRRGPHNARRPYVVRRFLDRLVREYEATAARYHRARRLDRPATLPFADPFAEDVALDVEAGNGHGSPGAPDPLVAGALARGESPPDGFEAELRSRLHRHPAVKEALERMWPVIDGAELVDDLLGFPALIRSASEGILDEREQALLHRPRAGEPRAAAWTEADVALVDEADHLLGALELARPRRRNRRSADAEDLETARRVVEEFGLGGFTTAANLAGRFSSSGNGDREESTEPRTFGHVLVDEAQDLTAMQWRMLARRCQSGSMTLVGDPGQASRPGAIAAWPDVLAHLPTHHAPRFATLSVNYRTPAEIMDLAGRLLAVAAPAVEPSTSVRATGRRPRFVAADPPDLIGQAASAAREAMAEGGAVAVIAPLDTHADLVGALCDVGAVAEGPEALDALVAILDATAAKGLEFDHVVVVEPSRLVEPDRAGLRLLYVTLTRATKTLTVVHAEPLPEALHGA